ncbi:hypothetical protein [Azospirillum griseum]|uniref:hypothetical protein n=1 Tax=Azospirillum griseum TaxID=2496639 RepID=UPI001FE4AFE6|nr:hypothetical protein [Azospirillum griseum]
MRVRSVSWPLVVALAVPVLALEPAVAQTPPSGPIRLPFPPGYVEEPENPPEDPLPPLPRELEIAPSEPVHEAPDAAELLKACKEQTFTDCFRLWRPPPPPPPPPPEPEPDPSVARSAPPSPSDPKAPREPAKGGPVPPPPSNAARDAAAAEADKATFDALAKALKETGLDGKVLLTNPAGDGPTLQLDSKPTKAPPKKP